MVVIKLLLSLLLALSALSKPVLVTRSPITLSLSRRVNLTSVHNLVEHDQARASALKARGTSQGTGQRAIIPEPITNQAITYVASMDVGSPPTTYQILVDTGSSNTWIGANKSYTPTSTSIKTNDRVSVSYGSGSFIGIEYIDRVSFGFGLDIPQQSIGVASTSVGLQGLDGILGIGPTGLTVGTLSPDSTSSIPTVTDSLFDQDTISAHEISVYFEPTATNNNENGEITWGGTNLLNYLLPITYIPITDTFPSNTFFGIDQSIRYGESTTILSTTAGIVDTGSTLILLATDAFNNYRVATGSTLDGTTKLLTLPSSKYSSLKSLFFITGGETFELIPNAQIWPRLLNSQIGGVSSQIYLIVGDLKSPSGEGLDFINGLTFLERFYSVYDTANSRVGLADTLFTDAEIN